MAFKLPPLSYAVQALEPFISARTLEFHYGKHHQTYVNNLNGLIPGTDFEASSLEEIIKKADGPIFNNGAQVWNHNFYFESLSPSPLLEPQELLAKAIERDFGSFEAFREEFTKSALALFGSGWTWLVKNEQGKLSIIQEPNAGNPLRKGLVPLMTCDVWEHAYYLDYQNRRQEYINAFWKVLDWKKVSSRY